MPKYFKKGDAIEGKKILCEFKECPFLDYNNKSRMHKATLRGNPASATISKVWEKIRGS